MSKLLLVTLPWDRQYELFVAPISGRFAADQNHTQDLNPATTDTLGGVIVGDNLVVDENGRLSATGSGVAGVSSFNKRVGAVVMYEKDVVDALGFKPVNYRLPVASKDLLGGVKQGDNVTIAEDGTISVEAAPKPYNLPVASESSLGGIKVGKNLSITPEGVLSAADTPPAGVTAFNGRKGDVKLTKKDVTDVVDIPKPYDLPVANTHILGGVKVGRNLAISEDGTLDAEDQAVDLKPATEKTLGGVIVGDNLVIDEKGRLSAIGGGDVGVTSFNGRTGRINLTTKDVDDVIETASRTSLGVIKVGKNLTIDPDGTLNADNGTETGVISFNGREGKVFLTEEDVAACQNPATKYHLGAIKVGKNLTVEEDGTLNAEGGDATAGVNSFNGRQGDVTLKMEDVLEVAPVADNDGFAGIVQVTPNGEGSVTINPLSGALEVNTDVLLEPNGGLIVAEGEAVSVNVDGETVVINDKGQIQAVGGGTAGVVSFNTRTGAVTLTKQDVLGVVDIPDPYALPIASDKVLGGVMVGSGLQIDANGKLSATSGDAVVSHRMINHFADEGAYYEHFTPHDVNAYVTMLAGKDSAIVAVLTKDIADKTKEGDVLTMIAPLGSAVVASDSMSEYIINTTGKKEDIIISRGGVARLVNLGYIQVDKDYKPRCWGLLGNLEGEDIEIEAPVLVSLKAGDGKFTATWTQEDGDLPVQYFQVYCDHVGHERKIVYVDGSERSVTIDGLVNLDKYSVFVVANNTAAESESSNTMEVTPTPDVPKTFTLNNAFGIYDGVNLVFTIPTGSESMFVSYNARIGAKTYPVTEYIGDGAYSFKGVVHGLESQTADVTMIGVDKYGNTVDSNTIKNVLMGAQSVTPTMTGWGSTGVTLRPRVFFNSDTATGVKAIKIFARHNSDPMETCEVPFDGGGYAEFDRPLRANETYKVSFAFVYELGTSKESNSGMVTLDGIDRSPPTDVDVYTGSVNPRDADRGYVRIKAPAFNAQRIGTVIMINGEVVSTDKSTGNAWIPSSSYTAEPFNLKVAFNLLDGSASEFLDLGRRSMVTDKPSKPSGIYANVAKIGDNTARIRFKVPVGDYPLTDMVASITTPDGKKSTYQITVPEGKPTEVVWDYQYPAKGSYKITYRVATYAGWGAWSDEQSFSIEDDPKPEDNSAPTDVVVTTGSESNPPVYDKASVSIKAPKFDARRIGTVLKVNDVVVAKNTDGSDLPIPTDCYTKDPVNIKVAFNLAGGTVSDFKNCGNFSILTKKPDTPKGVLSFDKTADAGVVSIKFAVTKGDLPLTQMAAKITDPKGKVSTVQIPLNYVGDDVVWSFSFGDDGTYKITYRVSNEAGWSGWTNLQSFVCTKQAPPPAPTSFTITQDEKDIARPWAKITPAEGGASPLTFRVVGKYDGDQQIVDNEILTESQIKDPVQIWCKAGSRGWTYTYYVYAIDKFGQESKPTTAAYKPVWK